jgi:predicted RNA-binding protein YlxR (DUF448 family)
VRTPARDVLIDNTGRMAGRGAYLCADGSCWAIALKKSALERALDAPLPAALRDQLQLGDPTQIQGGAHGT